MKDRIVWIDYAKVLGIYLVIFAHTPLVPDIHNLIYSFHIPLFFFLSGFLFSFEKYPDFQTFLKRRTQQLIVPYFFFSIVTYLFWVFIGRKFGNDAALHIPFYQPLLGIAYGNGIQPWMIHCIPLWFLPCLFLVEIMYYLLFKNLKQRIYYLIFAAFAGYLFIRFNTIRFPWSLNTSVIAVTLYGLGNVSSSWINAILRQKIYIQILGILVTAGLVYFISETNGRINMHVHEYSNYFLFLAGSLSGILLVIITAYFLQHFLKRNDWVELISRNTLTILGFHLIAGSLIKAITYFIFDIPLQIYEGKLWINIAFSLASLLLLMPVIYAMNTFFPIVLGNKNKKMNVTNQTK